jgi:hypothetical protein
MANRFRAAAAPYSSAYSRLMPRTRAVSMYGVLRSDAGRLLGRGERVVSFEAQNKLGRVFDFDKVGKPLQAVVGVTHNKTGTAADRHLLGGSRMNSRGTERVEGVTHSQLGGPDLEFKKGGSDLWAVVSCRLSHFQVSGQTSPPGGRGAGWAWHRTCSRDRTMAPEYGWRLELRDNKRPQVMLAVSEREWGR